MPEKRKRSNIVDITERKRAEEALMESETKFKMIVENIRDVVFQLSPLGIIQYVSTRVQEVYGYKPEDLVGKHLKKTTPISELPKALSAIKSVFSGKVINNLEINQLDSKGKIIPMEINATPVRREGKIIAVQGIMRDVTERKQAEEALRRAHDELEIRIQERSEELARTNEVLQAEITDRKKGEQLQRDENYVLTLLGQGAELSELLDAIVRLGESHDPSIKGSVLLRDSSKEWLVRASGPSLPDDYNELLKSGVPIGPNVGSCGTAAYLKEQVIVTDIENSPLFKPYEEVVRRTTKNGLLACWSQPIISSNGDLLGTIANYSNKVGEPNPDSLRVLEWAAQIAAIAIERKQAEEELREAQEQLVRSEKLAAIGQLAGGVGHELRNPLGAIKNAVYYVKGKVAKSELAQEEPRLMEFLDIMDEEINSSNKIISDLLGFSRVGKPSVSPTRIEKVIEDTLSRIAIPENIELTKKLNAKLPEVNIDPDQIEQVLVNIITNAVQAMPEGGKLTIVAREKNRFLEVEIADTGCGIPQEAVDKIFDPLFTTKAKGIGLGLAVCKSIIDRHEGNIAVKSKVGKGTTFNLKLPLKRVDKQHWR